MKTAIIVQARMGSTRLPGKILKEVLGKSLLEYQIERLRRSRLADEIIIATTANANDDAIVELCRKSYVKFFRGSEEDVLSRYYEAAFEYEADLIVRVTSDCPLVDPVIIDKVIEHYNNNPALDYVSNTLQRTYPRGMDTEAFPFHVLKQTCSEAVLRPEREHVTPFIYNNPQRFSLANIANPADLSNHRWTVDTAEDFELIKNIIEAVYPHNPKFAMVDILEILDQNPQWNQINAFVEQKEL